MQTAISDILHIISQALLVPDIILLLALIAYAIFSIGSILMEWVTEHRRYQVKMPEFLDAIVTSQMSAVPSVIQDSGLLRRQREALMTVYEYRNLPGDALIALVRRLMNQEEAHYSAITSRNNMAAKIAPMLGLVGTLIPLGPGIEALGKADTAMLSSSLLVAFDTTVAGLVTAAVCLVIGKIRSTWYDNYLSALDSAMATLVQKIEDSRAHADVSASASAQVAPPLAGYDTYDSYGNPYAVQGANPLFGAAPANAIPTAMPIPPTDSSGAYTTPSGMPVATPVDSYGVANQAGYHFEPTSDPLSDGTLPVD